MTYQPCMLEEAEIARLADIANTLADKIVQLNDRLAAAEAERDELREQLTHQSYTLTAEHQRAERILSALREPSDAVLKEIARVGYGYDPTTDSTFVNMVARRVLRTAVAAAEKEVDRG